MTEIKSYRDLHFGFGHDKDSNLELMSGTISVTTNCSAPSYERSRRTTIPRVVPGEGKILISNFKHQRPMVVEY